MMHVLDKQPRKCWVIWFCQTACEEVEVWQKYAENTALKWENEIKGNKWTHLIWRKMCQTKKTDFDVLNLE